MGERRDSVPARSRQGMRVCVCGEWGGGIPGEMVGSAKAAVAGRGRSGLSQGWFGFRD